MFMWNASYTDVYDTLHFSSEQNQIKGVSYIPVFNRKSRPGQHVALYRIKKTLHLLF